MEKDIAEELIKLNLLFASAKNKREARNIINMIIALTSDIRVLIIKLNDELNALRKMDSEEFRESFSDEEKKSRSRNCLYIYAPLADILGISNIKNEMEDLALKFINRDAFVQIKDLVAEKLEARNIFLEHVQDLIRREAEEAGIKIEVLSRAKHFYSIYQKMRKRRKDSAEIFDLSGIRIITENIEDCYSLLGLVHRLWKPMDRRFKDYIAMPKPNGYKSLHTSVMVDTPSIIGDGGEKSLEIQIRTREMNHVAEHGIASHFIYKTGLLPVGILPEMLSQENTFNLDEIKKEIFKKWVYVFTPGGKVIELTAGSTPIDFAYQVHTAIGEKCVAAKANGHIIPLSSELKNTQIIEILTNNSAHPTPNWLTIVKTSKARSRIRAWLEKNDPLFFIDSADKNTEKEIIHEEEALPELDIASRPHLYYMPQKALLKVRIDEKKNTMVKFARCCNPVTGDDITGYISRGRGVIIHRSGCKNLLGNPEYEERKIDVLWESEGSELLKRFNIETVHSENIFPEIEGAIRSYQGHLMEGRLEEIAGNRLSGIFTMQIMKEEDLKPIVKKIRGIPDIIKLKAID